MSPQDPNKVNLEDVNKAHKQKRNFSASALKSPLKVHKDLHHRDEFGQFANKKNSGSAFKSFKKFQWGRAFPLFIAVALMGGFLVYRSFAGTYKACVIKNGSYVYNQKCVTDSDEASIVRLYYAAFNRVPDAGGLKYWTGRLNGSTAPKLTLTQITKIFMDSKEFNSRYLNLPNQAFVTATYEQALNRAPEAEGLKFWTEQLNSKKYSRERMLAYFVQSPEMKQTFAIRVALALGISPSSIANPVKAYASSDVVCYGTKRKNLITNKQECSITYDYGNGAQNKLLAGINIPEGSGSGQYIVCSSTNNTNIKPGFTPLGVWVGSAKQSASTTPATPIAFSGDMRRTGDLSQPQCVDLKVSSKNKQIYFKPIQDDFYTPVIKSAAKQSVVTNSISLYKVNGQYFSPEDQNDALVTNSSKPCTVVIAGKDYSCLNTVYQLYIKTNGKTSWTSNVALTAGKSTFTATLVTDSHFKFRVVVRDAVSGKELNNYTLKTSYAAAPGTTTPPLTSTPEVIKSQPFTINNYSTDTYKPNSYIIVGFDTQQPKNVVVQIKSGDSTQTPNNSAYVEGAQYNEL